MLPLNQRATAREDVTVLRERASERPPVEGISTKRLPRRQQELDVSLTPTCLVTQGKTHE